MECALKRVRLTLGGRRQGVGCGEVPAGALAGATRPVPGHRNDGARCLLDSARCLVMASTSADIKDVSLHVKPQTHSPMIGCDTTFPSQSIEISSHTIFLSSATEPSNTPVDMTITADDEPHGAEINEHMSVDPTSTGKSQLAQLANQEDHEVGKLASFHKYPWACFWSTYAVWVVLLVSFENQAAGSVIGIPEFRKDFGHATTAADGTVSYVIDANWQSAFQGAPVAS